MAGNARKLNGGRRWLGNRPAGFSLSNITARIPLPTPSGPPSPRGRGFLPPLRGGGRFLNRPYTPCLPQKIPVRSDGDFIFLCELSDSLGPGPAPNKKLRLSPRPDHTGFTRLPTSTMSDSLGPGPAPNKKLRLPPRPDHTGFTRLLTSRIYDSMGPGPAR